MEKTLDHLIILVGSKFRGLWRSKPITEKGVIMPDEWFVTFEFRTEMQEVGPFKYPSEALISAIETLKIE